MSDIFNTMPAVSAVPKTNSPVARNISVYNSHMKPAVKEYDKDSFELTNRSENTEKSLTSKIKGIAKNSVIGSSLVYTGGSAFNYLKEKTIKKPAEETAKSGFKLPAKPLAIATGVLTAAAGLWTIYTEHKIAAKYDNSVI